MADTKISNFSDGLTANATDRIATARSPFAAATDNVWMTPDYLGTYFSKNTLAAGTIVTSQPHAITQTWNDGAVTFTAFKINATSTASAAASLLADLQLAGSSIFSFDKAGIMRVGTSTFQLNIGGTKRLDWGITNSNALTISALGTDIFVTASTVSFSGLISFNNNSYFSAGTNLFTMYRNDAATPAGLVVGSAILAKTSAYPIVALDSNKVFTNEGATGSVVLTLPSAVTGYRYYAVCQDADGIQLTAAAGDTIRIAASATPAAGNISSTTIGSTVTLVAINVTEWIAVAVNGVWVVSV